MSRTYRLTVNGEPRSVDATADTSLLEVLRNDLGLKSPKFGCGLGQCGACFVWIDGHPSPACDTPIELAEDRDIRTLEGIGTEAQPHALQEAFLENQAGQCGYCLSGILMSAVALLRDNPSPSRDEVNVALDRNLCRCGTHQRIVDAVLSSAKATS